MSALADLEPDVLDAACRRAMQTCKFFPAPAEIRAQIETAQQGAFEDEWQALLDYCCEWVHPDIRFSGTPSLPAEIDHAARAAGGVHFLRECSQEELGWRKKAFIEDLSRSRKTGDLAGLLTGGELRKLLNRAAQPAKQLPAPKPEERQQAIEEAAPLKRAVLHRWPSEARKAPTPEEVERQKQFVLQKYPKPGNMDGIPPELRPVEVSA
ncbi:MAG: hypothetical protein LAN84_04090 [Acidobacteriia bacterium]|nr:hypothetical protein [Terriglobia bacterium]